MKIRCHFDSSLPAHAQELTERRCDFALGRFDSVIEELFVTLTDENGPKGGESIRCVIRVRLHRLPDVIIHEQADIFERALGLAMERASQQVARVHGRRGRFTQTIRRDVMPLFSFSPALG